MIRVDHAGEYGAKRIYDGQLAVLGRSGAAPAIREMAEAEQAHLDTFDTLLVERRVRPTALSPVVARRRLCAGCGERAARRAGGDGVHRRRRGGDRAALRGPGPGASARTRPNCARRLRSSAPTRPGTAQTGLAHGAERAPGYEALGAAVKRGTRLAIWLSERI
ncbi:5-demethoxyubiquinone hydroxylase, mitochondrial [Geodia barretti]|uniref:5-demethoxyubiquinone hydroxylase, mitochondrial n=1 Tax=Geodia barretti TaxID=519541 RepID=A0AA35XH96_GEOBA|nr:5-demethoxyubiquinone hydroxylase, mitochondrial [Geodia barretti]